MTDQDQRLTLTTAESMADIAPEAWNALAGPDNPFLSHAFLHALETSGSVSERTGWLPRHLLLSTADGRLIGAVPLYLKAHSWGEYVFDQAWARAYEQAGGAYYPKLQAAVPFTPVPGPRLLAGNGPDAPAIRRTLAEGLSAVAGSLDVSGVHVTFLAPEDVAPLAMAGFMARHDVQFHWHNRGYGSFDDFLAALSARKRKMIRKEREKVRDSGLVFRALSGEDLTPAAWDAFHRFYRATVDRKWGEAYLTRSFFNHLGESMADRVVLIMAYDGDRPVAGALNLIGKDTLYGRNWGAVVDLPFLHFETCYYQAMEVAIDRGLARVEAGAQGGHKLLRGYEPVTTRSAHWLADPRLAHAVKDFLDRERAAVDAEAEALGEHLPFRRDQSGPDQDAGGGAG
ncbi:GNAT family N-acetyltransferase [Tistrella mobilis]|uniref:GNAT family N-acetyltransferase n=1 Tax=Tistrella mobilis TaxID=171437 RepID=UPI0031F6D17B